MPSPYTYIPRDYSNYHEILQSLDFDVFDALEVLMHAQNEYANAIARRDTLKGLLAAAEGRIAC